MALDDGMTPPRSGPTGTSPTFDPARLVGDERLPCGRLVSDVWERVRAAPDHPDSHTADCPHCGQAAEGLAALDRATRGLRAERPSARAVAERVVDAVRAETRLGRMLPLDDAGRDLRVAEVPAARLLRQAADRVPGMRAASCRLTQDDGSTTVVIAMTLAATLDRPLPDRAADVRRAVAYAARQQLGLAVGSVDLKVVSVLEPWKPSAAADPVRGDRDFVCDGDGR